MHTFVIYAAISCSNVRISAPCDAYLVPCTRRLDATQVLTIESDAVLLAFNPSAIAPPPPPPPPPPPAPEACANAENNTDIVNAPLHSPSHVCAEQPPNVLENSGGTTTLPTHLLKL